MFAVATLTLLGYATNTSRLVADKAFATKEWAEWSNYTAGCAHGLRMHGDLGIALTHIPKTAGSMLEALGTRNGVCWGRFLRHRDSTCGVTQAMQCVGPWFHQPPRGCVRACRHRRETFASSVVLPSVSSRRTAFPPSRHAWATTVPNCQGDHVLSGSSERLRPGCSAAAQSELVSPYAPL